MAEGPRQYSECYFPVVVSGEGNRVPESDNAGYAFMKDVGRITPNISLEDHVSLRTGDEIDSIDANNRKICVVEVHRENEGVKSSDGLIASSENRQIEVLKSQIKELQDGVDDEFGVSYSKRPGEFSGKICSEMEDMKGKYQEYCEYLSELKKDVEALSGSNSSELKALVENIDAKDLGFSVGNEKTAEVFLEGKDQDCLISLSLFLNFLKNPINFGQGYDNSTSSQPEKTDTDLSYNEQSVSAEEADLLSQKKHWSDLYSQAKCFSKAKVLVSKIESFLDSKEDIKEAANIIGESILGQVKNLNRDVGNLQAAVEKKLGSYISYFEGTSLDLESCYKKMRQDCKAIKALDKKYYGVLEELKSVVSEFGETTIRKLQVFAEYLGGLEDYSAKKVSGLLSLSVINDHKFESAVSNPSKKCLLLLGEFMNFMETYHEMVGELQGVNDYFKGSRSKDSDDLLGESDNVDDQTVVLLRQKSWLIALDSLSTSFLKLKEWGDKFRCFLGCKNSFEDVVSWVRQIGDENIDLLIYGVILDEKIKYYHKERVSYMAEIMGEQEGCLSRSEVSDLVRQLNERFSMYSSAHDLKRGRCDRLLEEGFGGDEMIRDLKKEFVFLLDAHLGVSEFEDGLLKESVEDLVEYLKFMDSTCSGSEQGGFPIGRIQSRPVPSAENSTFSFFSMDRSLKEKFNAEYARQIKEKRNLQKECRKLCQAKELMAKLTVSSKSIQQMDYYLNKWEGYQPAFDFLEGMSADDLEKSISNLSIEIEKLEGEVDREISH